MIARLCPRHIALGATIAAAVLVCLQPWSLLGHSDAVGQETPALLRQTREQAFAKSAGCIQCHKDCGDPHEKPTINLGCIDCHGGDPASVVKERAHVLPRIPDAWRSSANPVRSYTLLNYESPEFIRFVNPGDLRIAHITCGNCHANEVQQNRTSMMTHGAMLWGAALYNNGAYPHKQARFGESYAMNGTPQRLLTWPPPTEEEMRTKGVLPYLDPLARFEISQPGNILRIFERGGRFRPEIGIPEREEESGRPRTRLSTRGLGTENAHRSGLRRPTTHTPLRSDSQFPRHQRSCRRLPLQRLHRLPCNLRQRSLADPFRAVRRVTAIKPSRRTPIRPSRRTSRAIRSSTSSPRRFPAASASSATSIRAPTS